jgi:hypothetical protein
MNYLKYIYYLKSKDVTEYTGIESYVDALILDEVAATNSRKFLGFRSVALWGCLIQGQRTKTS